MIVQANWRDAACALRTEGRSLAEIKKELRKRFNVTVALSTVWRTVRKTFDQPMVYRPNRLIKVGRLFQQIKSFVHDFYLTNMGAEASAVLREVEKQFGFKGSQYFLRRVRRDLTFVRRRRRYGAMVRALNRVKRVQWIEDKQSLRHTFLHDVFTDESAIWLNVDSRDVWVLASDAHAHITHRPKHLVKVMIWAGISSMGATQVCILGENERVDSERYIRILEEYYLPFNKRVFGGKARLVQDNAPPHVSKKTRAALAAWGLEVDNWPPESPDMNPIELLWAHLKAMLRSEYKPKNKAQLERAIQAYWKKYVTPEFCRAYVNHIHRAMQLVLAAKGAPVKT